VVSYYHWRNLGTFSKSGTLASRAGTAQVVCDIAV
jgi:hypothetical protein